MDSESPSGTRFDGGSGMVVGTGALVKEDPDIEEAIQRWGSMKSSSLVRKSSISWGKFSRQNSLSVMDVLAEGGKVEILPYYDIVVKNLTYKVSVKTPKEPSQKVLLNGVSAEAYHEEVLAIVGPSGSGKTTFLDALAGRVACKSLQGEIYVNGELIDESFKRISGYVMQDDALFPMLTVRETLLYSALLRLSNSMLLAEKKIRVDNMIKQLGLAHCADTRVGNEKIRGVSGGERRRVSIGADLIHDPAVLFLDEPTSGLDSTSALNIMENLLRMARTGRRTVLLTIHQPSYRILDTIDRVLVLGMGNVVYHGPQREIKHYFDPLGRSMPEMVNVIEYALDTIEDYQRSPEGLEPLRALHASNMKVLDEEKAKVTHLEPNNAESSGHDYATPFLSECLVLSDRNLKNHLRTPELFLSRVGLMIIVAITSGALFLRVGVDANGVRQRSSFLAFALAIMIFTSIEAIGVFIEERQIFIRETSRGAYRAASYVISGAVVNLPFLLILAILFTALSYFIVGLVADTGAFFFFILNIWLSLCMANSFVCLVSAIVPNFTVGNSLSSAIIAYFFVLSGFFIQRDAIPKYWLWLHYLSLFKYPYESLVDNEFSNKKFDNSVWGNLGTSQDVLDAFSVGAVHQWVNVLVMIIFVGGYRFLLWCVLKFFTKNVRS